jgi:hypothetical protein
MKQIQKKLLIQSKWSIKMNNEMDKEVGEG